MPSNIHNRGRIAVHAASCLLACLLLVPVSASASNESSTTSRVDGLMAVDCLLPPQLRKLGKQRIYSAPRRPIKTTASDCEIRGGEYTNYDRANYKTALQIWLPLATDGDAEAQTYVGEIYEKGLGLDSDPAAAAVWYRRAAEQGYSRAQLNLGALYEQGLGVPLSRVEALNWYRRASGLTSDDVVYASNLTAANDAQRELASLRQELTSTQSELRRMQSELGGTQSRYDQQRSELDNTRDMLALVSQKLAQERESSVQFRGDKAQAKLEVLEAELHRLQAELRNQQRQYKSLADQLSQQSIEVRERLKDRTAREQAISQQLSVAGPEIELTEPTLAVIRGVPAVRAPSQGQQWIRGTVVAEAGLLSLSVNGIAVEVTPGGSFKAPLALGASDLAVSIVAVDAAGRETKVDFTYIIALPEPMDRPAIEPVSIQTGQFFALLIGNANYENYPQLSTPLNDVRAVGDLLREKFSFNTTVIENGSRYQILSALNDVSSRAGPDDSVLVYFAGHGELDRINNRGYWLPVDAEPDNPANWLSNVAVTDLLNIMPASHVMVVADSCYSGALTSAAISRVETNASEAVRAKWLETVSTMRARTVLTSGGVKPVMDSGGGSSSVFAAAFLAALKNSDGIISGQDVFLQLARDVARDAAKFNVEQRPRYAPIRHAGHEAGEFLFVPNS